MTESESMKWHKRLGYIEQERLSCLAKNGLTNTLNIMNLSHCEPCLADKASRNFFGKANKASAHLDLIHSDIRGPMSVRNQTKTSKFITFIDDYCYNHFCWHIP